MPAPWKSMFKQERWWDGLRWGETCGGRPGADEDCEA